MSNPLNTYSTLWFSLFISLLALLGAIGLGALFHLEPCHLCLLQRFFYSMIIGASTLGLVFYKKIPSLWSLLNILAALLGLLLAARQSWLQHFPSPEPPACLPSWSLLTQVLSPLEAVLEIIKGAGDCSRIDGSFLGLTMAEWSGLTFLLLLILNTHALFTYKNLTS